jgi:hypothetical protein
MRFLNKTTIKRNMSCEDELQNCVSRATIVSSNVLYDKNPSLINKMSCSIVLKLFYNEKLHFVWYQFLVATNIKTAVFSLFVLMMESVNTSETSVNIYQITWRNIPDEGHFHKLHLLLYISKYCYIC